MTGLHPYLADYLRVLKLRYTSGSQTGKLTAVNKIASVEKSLVKG